MKISIIIATFNSGKTLRQTLDSIRHQTYKELEVIVVDGKSSDNTLDIIEEYSDTVTRYISESDTGIYNAFNKGIDLATGDYICFVGSDDCYCNYNVFARIIEILNPDVDMLSCPVIMVDEEHFTEKYINNFVDLSDVKGGAMIPHAGMITKLAVMRRYKFNEKNKIISDYEFLLKYLNDGGRIKFANFPVVYYSNQGVSSISRGSNNWCRNLLEHIVLYSRLNMPDNDIVTYIKNECGFDNMGDINYHFRCINRIIREKTKLVRMYTRIKYFFVKKHECNLITCRWCKRGAF